MVVRLRHELHSHPEVGNETPNTRAKIAEFISGVSYTPWDPIVGGDLVGDMKCGEEHTILLRSDIDALPMQEESDLPYRSGIAGKMHACGHDGHAAMLAGAVRVLSSFQEHLSANIRFVFQPGEETIGSGRTMVERGVCEGCDEAYAIHSWPGLETACVSTKEGPIFAAGSHFTFEIKGKGCHGAMPQEGINPIPIAARIAENLHDMHLRMNAVDGTVISICSFQSGSSSNIIPDSAIIQGTARYLDPPTGDLLEDAIIDVVNRTAHKYGAEARIEYDRSYDIPVLNTKAGFERVRTIAETCLPPGSWHEAEQTSMGMEDFAYYLKGREGALIRLGIGKTSPGLHSCNFDFDDNALEAGILMHCLLALTYR